MSLRHRLMIAARVGALVIPLVALTHCTKLLEKNGDTSTEIDTGDGTTTTGTTSTTTTGAGGGGGTLDATFGGGGKATDDFGGLKDVAHAAAAQGTKLLVVGETQVKVGTSTRYNFGIARYDASGNLDTTFGALSGVTSGKVASPLSGNVRAMAVSVLSDQSFVVAGTGTNTAGTSSFVIAKYQAAGVLDLTFGGANTGYRTTSFPGAKGDAVTAMVVDGSGRFIVVGYTYGNGTPELAMVRYTAAGLEDTTFGTSGSTTYQSTSGGLVRTFFRAATQGGSNGGQMAQAVAVDSQGRILVAGYVRRGKNPDFVVARFTTNGVLDGTFGNGGFVATDFGSAREEVAMALLALSDGSVVVGGYAAGAKLIDFGLAKFTSAGAPDTSFGTNGRVVTSFGGDAYLTTLAQTATGRIVAGGYARTAVGLRFVAARYTAAGALDTSFATSGRLAVDSGGEASARGGFIDSAGRLILVGEMLVGDSQLDFATTVVK